MKLRQLIHFLEQLAPPLYQESYDNSGLIIGSPEAEIKGVLTCLDSTEAVLDEAIAKGCNVVVAHHPIIFKGLKRITGKNYVERVVMKAIKHDIAIYAIHTNLDNMYYNGVNAKIAEKIGLKNTRILAPKDGLKKLSVVVPTKYSDALRQQLVAAGAGGVNVKQPASYAVLGMETRNGYAGAAVQLELLYTPDKGRAINKALQDTYLHTELSYHISSVDNEQSTVGSGMIGELQSPMKAADFLVCLKVRMDVKSIRHTALLDKPIHKVAVCGGAGGFLLKHAIRQKADIFITSDYKYHEFFDADGQLIIADIGHYESEQYTIALLHELISQKFTTFAAHQTTVRTNPVYYS